MITIKNLRFFNVAKFSAKFNGQKIVAFEPMRYKGGRVNQSFHRKGRTLCTCNRNRREERGGMVMAEKQVGPTPTEMDPWVCRRSRMVLFRIRLFSLPRPPIPFYYYFNNHQSVFVLKKQKSEPLAHGARTCTLTRPSFV